MSVDRLSNMLSALKNASLAGNKSIEIPHSKECESVAIILKKQGFLDEVKVFKEKGESYKKIRLDIVYKGVQPSFTNVRRVSKPGRRIYAGTKDMKPVSGGHGVMVVSTSRGIMESMEAKKKKLGGELLCKVW